MPHHVGPRPRLPRHKHPGRVRGPTKAQHSVPPVAVQRCWCPEPRSSVPGACHSATSISSLCAVQLKSLCLSLSPDLHQHCGYVFACSLVPPAPTGHAQPQAHHPSLLSTIFLHQRILCFGGQEPCAQPAPLPPSPLKLLPQVSRLGVSQQLPSSPSPAAVSCILPPLQSVARGGRAGAGATVSRRQYHGQSTVLCLLPLMLRLHNCSCLHAAAALGCWFQSFQREETVSVELNCERA